MYRELVTSHKNTMRYSRPITESIRKHQQIQAKIGDNKTLNEESASNGGYRVDWILSGAQVLSMLCKVSCWSALKFAAVKTALNISSFV